MAIEFLIIDANVLIDFCKTDRSVLALVTQHVGTVHVAEPVLAEVKELDRAGAESLGINVLTPEFPMLSSAASASVRSPLRFEDWLCLLIAEEESWTCVTNDKRLRVECEASITRRRARDVPGSAPRCPAPDRRSAFEQMRWRC
ncbi:MAG TPA: hypothetical protein VJN18_17340 [Polyangiaceae bacterium]|nr:hypothetical protein [Polyangiaceae bacterium]